MKKTFWVIVGIVVVVLVVWLLQKNVPAPISYQTNSPTPTAALKVGTKSPANTAQTVANTTYSQLLNQYAGRIVQFDDVCKATPGQMAVKKGTKIMLDNRSKIAKTVLLDGQSISLPAYNYSIVTMTTTKSLPYSMGIDCQSKGGASMNTFTVQIQASMLQQLP